MTPGGDEADVDSGGSQWSYLEGFCVVAGERVVPSGRVLRNFSGRREPVRPYSKRGDQHFCGVHEVKCGVQKENLWESVK